MSNRRSIAATFEIVTPMFLGGADHQATRIRETSIKGALAFWWRALNYAGFVEKAAKPDSEKPEEERGKSALALMQEKEQELFGGPNGQGAFLLKVTQQAATTAHKGSILYETGTQEVGPGARYFGYGLMSAFGNNAGHLEHSCLLPGNSFCLELFFRQSKFDTLKKEIIPVLKLFGLLGGLGSRVRRGWGSVSLSKLEGDGVEGWKRPKDIQDYEKELQELAGHTTVIEGKKFPVTAFAKETRIYAGVPSSAVPLKHLNNVGEAMQKYRSWGFSNNGKIFPPKVNKRDSEMNFVDDHDWSKGGLGRPNFVPKRIAFGLPQNYKDNGGVTGKQVETKEKSINRRASVLAIHIHKTMGQNSFAVLSLFPTKFLPTDESTDAPFEEVNANGTNLRYDFHRDGLPVLEHFLQQIAPIPNQNNPYRNGPYLHLTEVDLGLRS